MEKEPNIADSKKTADNMETYTRVLDIINQSTDDFLFVLDIEKSENRFFGPIDRDYHITRREDGINRFEDMLEIVHHADRKALVEDVDRIFRGEQSSHDMNYRWINRKGEIVWVNCRGKVIEDGGRRIMVGRVSEETLRHLYNPLTGLWNKAKLREDLAERINISGGYLMLIDVDGLAAINLHHGREFGDSVLKETARVLEELPNAEMAYQVNNNNFAVILAAETDEDVSKSFEGIRERMADKCTFTASAVPINKELFNDVSALLDSVRFILSSAKERTHDHLEFFSKLEISQNIESLSLIDEMKESVQNGCEGFEVYYQPQMSIGNYDMCAVEALLRYNSKSGEKIFPDVFIPLLEQTRLIEQVGLWVLETALRQCKEWRKKIPELRISVNFSMVQFEDAELAEKVLEILRNNEMPGDALTVEITETVKIQDTEMFRRCLEKLKKANISLAVDDFGTGYSNIGYLKDLNIDEIKIDREFIRDVEKDTYNYKLISNVVEFAKAGGIRVCCEGVESVRELTILEGINPDLLQGYLFDKPAPAESISKTYADSGTEEYRKRESFIRKLYDLKERSGVIHFDPKDILRQNGIGLWIIRIDKEENYFEMHADAVMERLLAVDRKYTPEECYDFWHKRISPKYVDYVHRNFDRMINSNKVIQLEYPWEHPKLGEVVVRCSGKRVADADGMIVLEGYHRIISNIEEY